MKKEIYPLIEQKEKLQINWVRPNIEKEEGEIKRVALEKSVARKEIVDAISTANLEELTEEMWKQLENTDSYHYVRVGHIEDAQKFAEKPDHNRDWRGYLQNMREGKPIESPIILVTPDGTSHLVSGNTRLMLARALGSKVEALMARMR